MARRGRRKIINEPIERRAFCHVCRSFIELDYSDPSLAGNRKLFIETYGCDVCRIDEKPVSCGCPVSDAWKCARKRMLTRRIACDCDCHRYIQQASVLDVPLPLAGIWVQSSFFDIAGFVELA